MSLTRCIVIGNLPYMSHSVVFAAVRAGPIALGKAREERRGCGNLRHLSASMAMTHYQALQLKTKNRYLWQQMASDKAVVEQFICD